MKYMWTNTCIIVYLLRDLLLKLSACVKHQKDKKKIGCVVSTQMLSKSGGTLAKISDNISYIVRET